MVYCEFYGKRIKLVKKTIFKISKFFLIVATAFLCAFPTFSLEYEQVIDSLSSAFSTLIDSNEGMTTFRTLYIPCGGRSEALGSAFTALADDVSYIEYNAAASSILDESELGVFHNSWISDASMDTVSYAYRHNDFGFGAQVKCFYVEFIERDFFEDVAKDYYSETTATMNFSYNFFSGYDFKGFAIGLNLKGAYRDMPDYTDNDTGKLIDNSGLMQSAFAFMADFGILMRFNLWKYYSSREPNFRIGISANNFGCAFTNLGSTGIQLDDPLPSRFAFGLSYKPVMPLVISFEFQQPINLFNPSLSEKWALGSGFLVQCTDFFALEGGFLLRGASPRFTMGAEFIINSYYINVNYTFDATSSAAPVNRISVSAKVTLGDGGRAEQQKIIDALYIEGLNYYAHGDMEKAINSWQKILEINKFFEPARKGIASAKTTLKLQKEILQANFFD